jgi:hypothetical protein
MVMSLPQRVPDASGAEASGAEASGAEASGAEASAGDIALPGGLTLSLLSQKVYRVLTAGGEHVGNLQLSNGQWKFKALGYDADGALLPGWGPLTDYHNTVFVAPDVALVNAAFALHMPSL